MKGKVLLLVLSVFIFIFSSNISMASTIDLPQTGQTTCYNEAGGVIACADTGQDGDWQAGVPWPEPLRFVSGTGAEAACMIDKLTGLMWPKNGNLAGGTTWQGALDYVASLNTGAGICGHKDWRLPNIVELRSLISDKEPNSAMWLKSQGFNNVQSAYYWSSSTYAYITYDAWFVYMDDYGFVGSYNKGNGYFVWPVRAGQSGLGTSAVDLPRTGQTACYNAAGKVIACAGTGQDGELQMGVAWPSPRYSVSGDCVTDSLTGLMWTKDANRFGTKTWLTALNSANGLNLCGFSDWRLPNVNELGSVVDYSKYDLALPDSPPFINVQSSYYWSSSTHANSMSDAWGVNMYYGNVTFISKNSDYYIWPVRGGYFGTSDLSITATDTPDPVEPSSQITYTLTVKNNGPDATNTTTLKDTLPTGTTFVSATPTGKCTNTTGVVSCDLGGLNNAATSTVTIIVTAPNKQGTVLTNKAVVSSPNTDPNLTNNTATTTTTTQGILNTSLTPSNITTQSDKPQTFTAVYTHTKGVANIKTVELQATTAGVAANGLWAKYDNISKTLYLYNDDGISLNALTCAPGSAMIITNNQGTLNCQQTTVSASGNNLTVNWNFTPSANFSDPTTAKLVKMKATPTSGTGTGLVKMGQWKILYSNTAPNVGTALKPQPATGATQVFTAVYTDPDGFANLKYADFLASTDGTTVSALKTRYNRTLNKLSISDATDTCLPGEVKTISNAQGSLDCALTKVTGTLNNLTIKWAVTAKLPFATTTAKQLKLSTTDNSDKTTGFVSKGTWTINAAPTLGTLTPANGVSSSGQAMAFTAVYSDANGFANLKTLEFMASASDSTAIYTIQASYDRAADKLSLNGSAVVCTPETAGSIANDLGSIDCLKTTVTELGNDITIKWTITPKAAFASGDVKQIQLTATDIFNETTGPVLKGTWSINTKPTVGTLTPSAPTTEQGKAQAFNAVYSDADGYTNLKSLDFLVSPTGTTANSMFVRYTRATNKLSIYDNAGTAVVQSCVLGSAGIIENTMGSVDCSLTTVTPGTSDITVNWNITPKAAFASATSKQIRLRATDNANATTGLVTKGDWTINTVPTLSAVTPSPMTTEQGKPQAFTAVYTDADGVANMTTLEFLVTGGSTANALYLKYDRASGKITLMDNDGVTPVSSTCAPATPGSIPNAQGSLNCGLTTVVIGTNTIAITFTVTPTLAFASTTPKNIRLSATDATGMTTGLTTKGTWTIIPTNTAPTLGNIAPSLPYASKAGAAQTFVARYSDADGYANLKTVELSISAGGSGAINIIHVVYDRANNKLGMYADNGTLLPGTCIPGEAKTLTNTQGTLKCATTTVTIASSNDLDIGWDITPAASYTGAKNVWMLATDNSGPSATIANKGMWTINP